jgi:undecaprenyl-diphosphatase
VVHHRAGGALDDVFVWLSRIGMLGLVWIGIGLALALLRRRPALLLPVLAADGIADLLARAIKSVVDIQRPAVRYAEPEALVPVPKDHSFPSGHAATSFACATVLTLAFPRLAVPLYVLAAAIAFSRVYVGVHYPLDVLGGAVLGVALAIALRWLARARPRSRRARPAG